MKRLRNALPAATFMALTSLTAACDDKNPAEKQETGPEESFRAFLQEYWAEIKDRDKEYLKSIHPELPEDMYDFFFDATLQMMEYSEDKNLERTIDCVDLDICKVTYPQPNDSWAAQQFIRHDGAWRWLPQA